MYVFCHFNAPYLIESGIPSMLSLRLPAVTTTSSHYREAVSSSVMPKKLRPANPMALIDQMLDFL
jgi:hypothetical protein